MSLISLTLSMINLYQWLLIARVLILSFEPLQDNPIANLLGRICDPYLNIFRGIIPPLAGVIDLNPMLALFTLHLLRILIIRAIMV